MSGSGCTDRVNAVLCVAAEQLVQNPTTARIRSMLKVWQAGLRPLSRPFPDLPSGSGDFQALRLPATDGCKPTEKYWRAWRRLPHAAEHSSWKPPVEAEAPPDRS